jgi:hypothetical protein
MSQPVKKSESKRLADQLQRSLFGIAWHGPSLKELLHGVSPEIAVAKPVAKAHSIWELVLHIRLWQDVALRRMRGDAADEVEVGQDWPEVGEPSEAAWLNAVNGLEQSGQQLVNAVADLTDDDLRERAAGQDYSIYFMLHGVVQHNLYHAGQIALLKKAQ